MTAMALKGLRKNSPYKHVYSNVRLEIEGLIHITVDDLGKYNIHDGLLLLDEASTMFDARDYKNFTKKLLTFFMLHRHWHVDICIWSQGWDSCDKRIRQITDTCYYCFKGPLTGKWFTRYYRIPYGIIIPDPDHGNEKLGEIIQGYCKPGLMQRIFGGWIYRPRYYKYFDSWQVPKLPELPDDRTHHVKPKLVKGRSRKRPPKIKEKTG